MAVLVVQVVATVLARLFVPWRDAVRLGLAMMFVFTAGSHFSSLKHDMAAMIPPPLTGALWVIYVTGVLEFIGAVGLAMPWSRKWAAWGLAALLVGMFPANVYAALRGVALGGSAATPLLFRTPLQMFWIALLVWVAKGAARAGPPRPQPSEVS